MAECNTTVTIKIDTSAALEQLGRVIARFNAGTEGLGSRERIIDECLALVRVEPPGWREAIVSAVRADICERLVFNVDDGEG